MREIAFAPVVVFNPHHSSLTLTLHLALFVSSTQVRANTGNTEYQGYTETSAVVGWFWNTVMAMTQEEKAWLLQFVTGTSQVPLEGFKGLVRPAS